MKKYYENLYKESKEKCYSYIESLLLNEEKKFIITANPETFMLGKKDLEVDKMLIDKENLVVADGVGITKTANMLNFDIKERIPGVDLSEHLFYLCNKYKKKVCILGSKEEVLDKLVEMFKIKYPNLVVGNITNGYIKDKDSYFEKIKIENPDVVLVALGIPNQEKLIYKHLNDFKKGIFIGVGGSLDVLSGSKRRSPNIFIKTNTEWLYRIVREPKRIKRFYQSNIKFLFKVIFNLRKWKNEKN